MSDLILIFVVLFCCYSSEVLGGVCSYSNPLSMVVYYYNYYNDVN